MKKYIKAINHNLKQVFYFEFFFKLISIIICVPCFKLVKFIIKSIYNIDYLTLLDIRNIMFKPVFLLIMFIILIIVVLYTLFDISSILLMINKGLDKEGINYKSIIKDSLIKTISVIKPKNMLYILYVILFIPFIYIGIYALLFKYIDILNLLYVIIINRIPIPILVLLGILYVYLIYKTFYLFNLYISENKSFIEAFKASNKLINIKDVLFIIFRKVVPIVIVYLLINKAAELFFYVKYLNKNILLTSLYEGLIIAFIIYLLFYYLIKSLINDLSAITFLYYYKSKESVSVIENKNKVKPALRIVKHSLQLLLILVFVFIMYRFNTGKIDYKFIYDYTYEVTAHRGASEYAPENSMAAFKLANDLRVDYIELDVHQAKDGALYVMHDNNLRRTTNLDKQSNKVNWIEIEDLTLVTDKEEYAGETVPLFEEVVQWAINNNVRLNIELKPTKTDVLLPDRVIQVLHKYDYTNCIIASFNIDAINRIHELDPSYEIVFLGYDIDFNYTTASYYSINYASITPVIVKEVHKQNKQIFAWTVNDANIVESMLNMGVDNIISNDPIMVKETIQKHKNKNKTSTLFDFIVYIF